MHTLRATRKRRISRGPALNGSARLTETGEGNGPRINAQFLASGVPQNATSFMKNHTGSSMRKYSAVTCQFGESAAKPMVKHASLLRLQLREQDHVADAFLVEEYHALGSARAARAVFR